jgi:D-alanyl-D-alanine-carboxypeptidase/D-alanyl-D-alanine-endopeptidase
LGTRSRLVVGCVAGGEQRVVGYGRLRANAQDTPDGDTIFEIGSVTMAFTALLLADLAEQGMAGLDDPLASYLPASVRVPAFKGEEITLGDLASHAGGLRRDPKGMLGRWLRDRRNPTRGSRSRSCTRALRGRSCGADLASASSTPTLGAGLLGEALASAAG